ncbi:MAG: sulfatase-like hydrolase/transferase, partial [Candidatus Aminicenantia bacterium]
VDEKVLKENGFYSLKEFNGFRFLDHCLGYYFSIAEKEGYFKNTIFVIFGDHGTTGGSSDRRFGDLSFGPFHIPFLIYSPTFIKEGKKIDFVASSLDILPTIASFVGVPCLNKSLGRDIFDPYLKEHFAFTFTPFRIPPRVGLIWDNFYVNVEPDGSYSLYLCDALKPRDLKDVYPDKAKKMADIAKGIHEYSKYLLYHNKKER